MRSMVQVTERKVTHTSHFIFTHTHTIDIYAEWRENALAQTPPNAVEIVVSQAELILSFNHSTLRSIAQS